MKCDICGKQIEDRASYDKWFDHATICNECSSMLKRQPKFSQLEEDFLLEKLEQSDSDPYIRLMLRNYIAFGQEPDGYIVKCCKMFKNPEPLPRIQVPENDTYSPPRKSGMSPIAKILIVILAALALLWGYGFVKGVSDINGGASLISVTYTMKAMNPISRSGYRTYMLNFTDVEQRIRSLQSTVSNW